MDIELDFLESRETDTQIYFILYRKLDYSVLLNRVSGIINDDSEHPLSSFLSSRFICLFEYS